MDSSKINPAYFSPEFAGRFNRAFASLEPFGDEATGAEIINYPFPVATLPNFLTDERLVDRLSEGVQQLPLQHKLNDLHDFYQSKDLIKTVHKIKPLSLQETFKEIVDVMTCSQLRRLVSLLTSLPLHKEREKMDLAAQVYTPGSRLLCHDDALEGRRIAFVLYLVDKSWSSTETGGFLDLFCASSPESGGHPVDVARSVGPVRNMLVFFQVTPVSFHQVSEVLAPREGAKFPSRVSISGWFYGPAPYHVRASFLSKWPFLMKEDPDYLEFFLNGNSQEDSPRLKGDSDSECGPDGWVSAVYQSDSNKKTVASVLKRDGVIQLGAFVDPKKLVMLGEGENIGNIHLSGKRVGPANYRNYSVLSEKDADVLSLLISFFKSDSWLSFLSALTSPRIRLASLETRVCLPGDYLLIHDDFQEKRTGFDVMYFLLFSQDGSKIRFCSHDWDTETLGGAIRYTMSATDQEKKTPSTSASEEVFSVDPTDNAIFICKIGRSSQTCMDYIRKCNNARHGFICILSKLSLH